MIILNVGQTSLFSMSVTCGSCESFQCLRIAGGRSTGLSSALTGYGVVFSMVFYCCSATTVSIDPLHANISTGYASPAR